VAATLRSVVKNGLAGTTLATGSEEAALSQGVAVFYFKTKQALLAAALRAKYEESRANWEAALAEAGSDPVHRIAALVRSDFDPRVCNREALTIWHAYWGEASARPLYAEISDEMDTPRLLAMQDACAMLLGDSGDPALAAAGIEALTNGLWQWLYLSPESMTGESALTITARHLAAAFPRHAERFEELLIPGQKG